MDRSFDSGQTAEVVVGRSVTVSVPAMGNPQPQVSWTLPSGRRLSSRESYGRYSVDESGTLKIRATELADSGGYTATVSNAVGKSSRVTAVRVFG